MTGALNLNGTYTLGTHAIDKDYADQKLSKSGGTMTGYITLHANPISDLQAAPKQYVDTMVPLTGGTMTGLLTLSGSPSNANHAATKNYVDTADNLKLSLAGGTMTGALTLSGAPTVDLHASTKKYVDDSITTLGNASLALVGGTMTGFVTLHSAPTSDLHAATKKYVDDVFAGDISVNFLSLAGGVMTGAITGDHELLPLAGDTMTGPIVLSSQASGTGLFVSSTTGEPMYSTKRILTEPTAPSTITADYTVTNTDREILVNNTDVVTVTLPVPTGFIDPIRIEKTSNNSTVVLITAENSTGRNADTVLTIPSQSITLYPSSNSWRISESYVPTTSNLYFTWDDPVDNGNAVEVVGRLKTRSSAQQQFTAVTDEGGGQISFTVDSTTGFSANQTLIVTASPQYAGEYKIDSVTSTKIFVTASYSSNESGGFCTSHTYSALSSATTVLVALSNNTYDPTELVLTLGALEMTVLQGSIVDRYGNWIFKLETTSTGVFEISVEDINGSPNIDTVLGYLHVLSAGPPDSNIYPQYSSLVSDTSRFQKNFTAIAQSTATDSIVSSQPPVAVETGNAITDATGDGGGVWIAVSDDSLWIEGFEAIISNSTSYNGTQTVLEVDTGNDRIRLDVAYVADETGDIYSNWTSSAIQSVEESTTLGNILLNLNFYPSHLGSGDDISITGTTSYNGTHTIVAAVGNQIEITDTFVASETGIASYVSSATLIEVADSSQFNIEDPISISGSASYNGDHIIVNNFEVSNQIWIDTPYVANDVAGTVTSEASVLTISGGYDQEYKAGDDVTIIGSSSSDGSYQIQSTPNSTTVSINLRFVATDSGALRNEDVVTLTTVNGTGLETLDGILVKDVEILGGDISSEALSASATEVTVRAPYGTGGLTGTIEQVTSKRLDFQRR